MRRDYDDILSESRSKRFAEPFHTCQFLNVSGLRISSRLIYWRGRVLQRFYQFLDYQFCATFLSKLVPLRGDSESWSMNRSLILTYLNSGTPGETDSLSCLRFSLPSIGSIQDGASCHYRNMPAQPGKLNLVTIRAPLADQQRSGPWTLRAILRGL